MKKYISLIVILLSCLFLYAYLAPQNNQTEKGIKKLTAYLSQNNNDLKIDWYYNQEDDSYYLFVPGNYDLNDLIIHYESSADVKCDKEINQVGQYLLNCDGMEYKLNVRQNSAIPSVFIDTASGNIPESKNNKEKDCLFVLYDQGEISRYNMNWLKIRGQSSSVLNKKPFTIEFENKVDLFDMGAEKKYLLIANYIYDPTMLKNKFTYDLGQKADIEYTTDSIYVDLYLNGNYWGNYLLCEPIEVNENRVNITDLEELNAKVNETDKLSIYQYENNGLDLNYREWFDLPSVPDDISGGYIIEAEAQDRFSATHDQSGFSTNRGQCMIVKAPEHASEDEVDYIAEQYQDFEDAICSIDGYNEKGQYYKDLIDFDSMVKIYIIQELSCDSDSGVISFFYYKDKGDDVFHMGPIWDYDRAYGSIEGDRLGTDLQESDNWWANLNYYWYKYDEQDKYLRNIFYYAWQHEDFKEAVKEYWNNLYLPLLADSDNTINKMADSIYFSAINNNIRWPLNHISDENTIISSYNESINSFQNFVLNRIKILTKAFNEDCPFGIVYNNELDPGYTDQRKIVTIGETVKISDFYYEDDKHHFVCWNTKEDGSGKNYYPGDEYVIKKDPLILYAIYDD